MAAHKSVFDPENTDDTPIRGGLDRFLAPPARSYSHMPEDLTDGKTDDESAPEVETDPESGRAEIRDETVDPERGERANPDEPVQQIKDALDEKLATEPTRPDDVESHPAD
jgi:hypothetical protein